MSLEIRERAGNGRKQEQRRELFPRPQSLLGDEERWNRTYNLEKDLQDPKREPYIIQKKISQTQERVSSPLDHSLFEESHRGGTSIHSSLVSVLETKSGISTGKDLG